MDKIFEYLCVAIGVGGLLVLMSVILRGCQV